MQNLFYKIKYFFGTIYRGLIGRYHNFFDKAPQIKSGAEWYSLGTSTQGRNIRCYKFGQGEKKVLLIGGIHGNEVGTVKLTHYLVNWLYNNQEKFFNLTVFVIPCLNPDGAEVARQFPDYKHRGRIGRLNARDVDLNRNFPTADFISQTTWKTGRDYQDETIAVFGGEFGGSEAETKIVMDLIKNENIKNVIAFHNMGSDVMTVPDDAVAENWAQIYFKKAKFKIRYNVNLSGSLSSWSKENNIHYLTVEGSSRWGSDWRQQHKAIEEILFSI